ncbi:hypothetical protein PMAYCL1PPCAC_27421, partial [Pristionchus mayeri]
NFLLTISSFVRDVHILVDGLRAFEMSETDYTELIIKMFSNKTEKLATYPIYKTTTLLSTNCIDILREELPKLGKKLWFETRSQIDDVDYTIYEHRVRKKGDYFSIKHLSRENDE